jgi:FOG: EAL domain
LRGKGHFWLNLPVAALLDPKCLSLLLEQENQNRLTIEIQEPEPLKELNTLEMMQFRAGMTLLRRAGWRIWLDDLTADLVQDIAIMNLPLDGVKIDRQELLLDPKELIELVDAVKRFAPTVLIEGIENNEMLEMARATSASYGQGFFWPESSVPLPVPASCSENGHLWHLENQLTDYEKTKILIDCEEHYFQKGLEYLLWSMVEEAFCSHLSMPVRLTRNESEANMILRDCMSGERPVACTLFNSDQRSLRRASYRQFIVINKESTVRSHSRCPEIEGNLSLSDTPEFALKLLKKGVTRACSQHPQGILLVKNAACTQCKSNVLTQREQEVVQQMAKGVSQRNIALQYGCKMKTVSAHKRAAMKKLNIKNNITLHQYMKQILGTSAE